MKITCPICGNKVRITRRKSGGGRVDCFACHRTWIVIYTSQGVVIQKIQHPPRTPVFCGQTVKVAA